MCIRDRIGGFGNIYFSCPHGLRLRFGGNPVSYTHLAAKLIETLNDRAMYGTLELASKLEDAPGPATKEELIDYATRSGAPLEVLELSLIHIWIGGVASMSLAIFSEKSLFVNHLAQERIGCR